MRNVYRLILGFGIIAFTLLSPQIVKTEQRSVKNHPITDNILRSKIAFAVVSKEIVRGLNLHTLSESDHYKLRGPVLLEQQTDIHFLLREQYGRIVNTVYFGAALDIGSPSQNSPIRPENEPVLYQKAAEIIRDFIAQRDISVIIVSNAPIGIGGMAAIRRLQGEVPYTYEIINSAAVSVPLKNIAALIKLPFITEIWPDRKGHLELDKSIPQIGADNVHNAPNAVPKGLGVTGKGVTVAVVDDGIDGGHSEFAGRIKDTRSAWNYHGGKEHGTHVAGIIGAADNGKNKYGKDITGVAPEVDFLDAYTGFNPVDLIDGVFISRQGYDYTEVMDAIGWAAQKHEISNANTKADVINLSAGWDPWAYGRTGTDPMSRLIDDKIPGIVFVTSAGNGKNRRASGTFHGSSAAPSGYSKQFEFLTGEATDVEITLVWDVSRPGRGDLNNDLDFTIFLKSDPNNTPICEARNRGGWLPGDNPFSGTTNYQTAYEQELCNLTEYTNYILQVEGIEVIDTQEYEVWLRSDTDADLRFEPPSAKKTVSVPGYSKNAITVGAIDSIGLGTATNKKSESIWDSSAHGPSDPYEHSIGLIKLSLIKPEVVAPGVGIRSTIPEGEYGSKKGTSMAAPHVSGVAALILDAVGKNSAGEWNFSPAEVKSAIVRGAENLTGNPEPNNEYGAGLVSADNIIFGDVVQPGSKRRFKITPALLGDKFRAGYLNAENNYPYTASLGVDFAVAISWEDPNNDLDLSLVHQNGNQLAHRREEGQNYEKISLFLLNSNFRNFFYLDVHNPGPNSIRFTGASTQPIGWIPDPNLEKAIQQEIGEIGNPITASKLRNLKTLAAEDLGIKDLTGLEHAHNLTDLNLSSNDISDISALTGLTKLNNLNLSNNNISDSAISALTKPTNILQVVSGVLTELNELDLSGNNISDISALTKLTKLSRLNLADNNISNIPSLWKLTKLDELDLSNNNISDISIGPLTNLSHLDLAVNEISDISALTGLTELNYLHLSNNNIQDISALAGLRNLSHLYLAANEISDISALAGLTGLNYLYLSNNNIQDISALAGLGNLYRLYLAANEISDISALSELVRLDDLNLSNNNISDISALSGLILLDILNLSNNRVSDISVLSEVKHLVNLSVFNNGISDISSLVGLASLNLKYLGIRTNPLNSDSVNIHIPEMKKKGVQVFFENRTPSALMKISGDMQEGEIDTALTTPFVVEVVDASGKPIAKVSVTFAITAGGGKLSTTTTITDAKGRASTHLTFGNTTGATTIRVTAENISEPVEFTATAKPSSSNSPVTIPDANLREEIVKTLGKPSDGTPTIKDMSTLTTLKASNVSDLTGLQHAHNLKTLRLEGDFTDVAPLEALIQLTNLNLSGEIIDVRPLENLVQLTNLHLWNNNITDLSPLAKLTKLTDLWLPGNNITDVSPLEKLTQLTSLYLNHNNITDVAPLANLTQLTSLYLRGNFHWNNRFTDVSPLKNLTRLRILDIADNHITDVSPLANLIQLTYLDLRGNTFWGNSLTDIAPLEKLTKLTELNLSRNYITDVAPLKNLTKLTRLRLWGNNITDVRPLTNLIQLTYLFLDGNNITDVAPLKNLIQLTYLDLGDNNITDVAPLENLTKLTRLNLYNNTIADISPLVGLNLTGTQGDSTGLSLEGNPLSYAAIHTHIPAMQAKGIVVKFDDRAHPALLKVSGDAQVGTPGAALPTPFVVEAMDASGKPIANVSVTFAITAGDGSLSTTTTTTDAKGRASTHLTFGNTIGETAIHVTAENISQPVEFTATASSRGTPVTIPDANLRAKIVETLGKSSDEMLTTEDMLKLTTLNARKANIHVLTGLQHAHNLKTLRLGSNNIVDISPLAELTQLTNLNLAFNVSSFSVNGLTDVTPLENLTQLRILNLGGNYITDVTPLENLPKLTNLDMWGNRITDVAHLAKLTQLTHLDLSSNAITDVAPLKNLTKLTNLDLSTNRRLDVSSLEKLTQLTNLDLSINNITDLSPLASSLEKLTQLTRLYLGDNNITDLSPLAKLTQLTDLMLWRNDITDVAPLENLTILTTLYLTSNNITNVAPLENLVGLTTLYLSSNSIADVAPLENLTQLTRLDLNNNVIADISPLVELNLTGTRWDSTGLSLEGNPLSYAAIHTQIPAMQAKGIVVKFDDRAHPALLKVSGDAQVGAPGTALPTPFVVEAMDASGKPIANVSVTFTITAGEGQLSATTLTTDTNGKAETVLTLGPSLGKQTVTATATEITPSVLTFTAIATEEPERFAADVNGDGEINIQDVVLVSSSLGQTGENAADVNGDGEVNIQDLVAVTAALGEVAAAPAAIRQQATAHLTQEEVQHWLTQAQRANLTDATSLRGIRYLEQLLSALTPKETALLANYPNPFNPETWIPYQLAKPADVTLTIYDIQGRVVQDLDLGHQRAGMYQSRSRAAYWDGKNAQGESVASGVYFYTLTTGDFTATRKLLIWK